MQLQGSFEAALLCTVVVMFTPVLSVVVA